MRDLHPGLSTLLNRNGLKCGMKYSFNCPTHARTCCGSTGHPASSQETRQRSHVTLDFVTEVLKSIYGCQTIHHFPSQNCLIWKFPTNFNSAIGNILKGQCGEPKDWQCSSNTEVSVGCLCEKANRIQIAKDLRILSQLGYLCVLPAVVKISPHLSVLPVTLLHVVVPQQKEIWLLSFLKFRAWYASTNPSVVFHVNASWRGWHGFMFFSAAPPAWVLTSGGGAGMSQGILDHCSCIPCSSPVRASGY